MLVLRSSPHEWVVSSGTSPRYSRELESNWTLARSAWHVTTMPAWSLVQDFSPHLLSTIPIPNLLHQDLYICAPRQRRMTGRALAKQRTVLSTVSISAMKHEVGFSPPLLHSSEMHLIWGDS